MNLFPTDSHEMWPQIRSAIYHKYEVVLWIDLCRMDMDMPQLYKQLESFSNFEFAPNQRIVIYHIDTDYYINSNTPGFTLWNVFKLYSALNVPTEYTYFISSQPGIEQELSALAQEFNMPNMQTVFCPYQLCPSPEQVNTLDLNANQVRHPYVCMNGQVREHRMYTLCQLDHQKILERGMVSLWPNLQEVFDNTQPTVNQCYDTIPTELGIHLRTTARFTRINDQLILDQQQRKIFHSNRSLLYRAIKHNDIDNTPNHNGSRTDFGFLQKALWNLVTETVGEYPYPWLTEKTFKAVLTKRPFILVSSKNSLKRIQDHGFKTFSPWINESYDQCATVSDRIDSAVKELLPFCKMSDQQLQQFLLEISSVLEYNFNHYVENFGKTEVDYFIENVL